MIEVLVLHYSNGNKAEFSRKIGVMPNVLSNWIARETFDAELIYAKCEGLSAHWLLSKGEGRMLEKR